MADTAAIAKKLMAKVVVLNMQTVEVEYDHTTTVDGLISAVRKKAQLSESSWDLYFAGESDVYTRLTSTALIAAHYTEPPTQKLKMELAIFAAN